MKKLTAILMICLFAASANAAARVKSMDLYPSGAKVVFEVDAGANMSFQIPASFNIDSVKPVSVPGITVDYFQKAHVYNSDNVPDVLKDLHRTIQNKEAEVAKLAAQISSNKSNLEMIMKLTSGDVSAPNPTEYVKSLMAVYEESSVNVNLLTSKHKEAVNELNKLKDDYRRRLPANYEQLIDINMGVKGQGKVLIEAFSNAAGWSPSYKMDLSSKTGEVRSIFVAQAHQRTGLNYNGNISFYTQNPPAGSLYAPRPNAMIVDFVPEERPAPAASRMMNQVAVEAVFDLAEPAPAPTPPMITESLTNFAVKGKASLKGDGAVVSVDLGETKYKAGIKVVLYRDYSREGHLIAKLEKIPEPFLTGFAELSVDGQNSGQTMLANYGRGEDVNIPFGFMPLIKVNKTTNVQKTGSGVFSGGTINDGYILEVVNGSEITAEIELIDRVPYSANDKITVDNVAIEPKADNDKNGVLTWKMTLKPGENRKFKVDYRVKHPSDKKVYFR